MILLTADAETLDVLFEIRRQRHPQELVILIGGGCCDGTQPQLLDAGILNPLVDREIGHLTHPETGLQLPVFATQEAHPAVNGMRLHMELLPVAPNVSLDRMSLEIAYGYQLILTRIPLPQEANLHQATV